MRKIHTILMFVVILAVQPVFAADAPGMLADSPDVKSCNTIADACLSAGFVKTESVNKGIWRDCMRPILLGKAVAGVTVNSAVVKACRVHKIEKAKMELKEFQKAQSMAH